ILSKDNVGVEQYSQILLYLNYCFSSVGHYFASSVIRSRDQHTGNSMPVLAVESSFCLSLRKHSWIPVIDQVKIPLKNENFINLLGFKREVFPITIFELFMKWSCNLDSNSLWNLINTYEDRSCDT
ncbi:unnamed protein product, partial [Rotaria sp. Silwood2]